jgi:enoyl-CoA hydratase
VSKVLYEKNGAIANLRLNRPDKLNAIDAGMLDKLGTCLASAAEDDDVRVLIVSGEGRAFSAGFDLDTGEPEKGVARADFIRREISRDFDAIMRFWDFPKPVIAAVHGYCLGSAMEISAVCDITIAAEGCRFGAPEVRFGSGIVCMILPWIVGQKNARELLLSGSDRVSAERALAIGLVNRVVPATKLMQETAALAEEIARNDAEAVRLTKKAMNLSLEAAGFRQALAEALELDIRIECSDSPESREFKRILAAEGPKAALRWRANRQS